jgi:hypothetical protein
MVYIYSALACLNPNWLNQMLTVLHTIAEQHLTRRQLLRPCIKLLPDCLIALQSLSVSCKRQRLARAFVQKVPGRLVLEKKGQGQGGHADVVTIQQAILNLHDAPHNCAPCFASKVVGSSCGDLIDHIWLIAEQLICCRHRVVGLSPSMF